jgi:methylmalonyl-CoA/ethylmalonyl-CoA epimerase
MVIPLKRVDHVSMAARNWKEQSALLQRLLGFRILEEFPPDPAGDFDGCTSQIPGIALEFEVISPTKPASFVERFLATEGPGLHHITVEVADINEAVAAIERLGMKPFGGVTDDGYWHITYLHPKESGGILWQIFQPYRRGGPHDRSTTGGAVGLKRLDHVSMAVRDLDRQVAWQQRVFGMEVESRWRDDQLGYDGCVLTIPTTELKFEVIAPFREDSFVERFLRERRPGMHHLCCEVESVEGAVEGLRREGIEAFGGIIEDGWKKHTFLHPRDSGGVLFQLFEEP